MHSPSTSFLDLADNVTYVPVGADSLLFRLAVQWQFPAYVISLGSSYFQRLLQVGLQQDLLRVGRGKGAFSLGSTQPALAAGRWPALHPTCVLGAAHPRARRPSPPLPALSRALQTMPGLQAAAQGLAAFAPYLPAKRCLCSAAGAAPCAACHTAATGNVSGTDAETTLRSIQFACVFLACKAADQVHALGLLRYMLSALSGGASHFSMQQAAAVEERCLVGLQWRLGPWFAHDDLQSDDYEQLATAMGLLL